MSEKDTNYYINNPIFVKYKAKFELGKMTKVKRVKKTFVNERIVETPFTLQSLPSDKNSKILDLGCTESPLSMYMASIGYKVIGVDARFFPYKHPNFEFIEADIMKLPFEEGSFDVVTCVSTLEHIGLGFYSDEEFSQQPDAIAMKQIYRVLKSKGTLILTVPFGVKKFFAQQRIYDSDSLNSLLTDFSIEKRQCFYNVLEDNANYWKEVPETEAGKTESDGGTNCVCLIKAVKE